MSLRRRFSGFRGRLPGAPAARDAAPRDADDEDAPGDHRISLVVGLGNPGPEYRDTRHNAGARCIERLAERHGSKLDRDKRVWRATVDVEGRTLHLAWPRSYYNESGGAVQSELRRLSLRPRDLLVVYDEIDLPVAEVRMRPHGGHGGNNGMRSIIDALGGGDFARVRIGIDRPYDNGAPVRDPDRVADWVLSKPRGEERDALDAATDRVIDAIERAAVDGVELAMTRLRPSG